jgi:hypothetical protein
LFLQALRFASSTSKKRLELAGLAQDYYHFDSSNKGQIIGISWQQRLLLVPLDQQIL